MECFDAMARRILRSMPAFTCEAVLFDLDGVLLDSNHVYEEHWKRWAASRGVGYDEIAAVHHGIPAEQTIRRVAPHLDAKAEARQYNRLVTSDTDITGIKAYPGIQPMLLSLPAGRWAIVTSAMRDFALRLLKRLDLPVPRIFVSHGDAARGKPSPDPYILAAARLGIAPRKCIVIEDAPAGVTAARCAGARVIAVTNTNPAAALGEADIIISAVHDITFRPHDRGIDLIV